MLFRTRTTNNLFREVAPRDLPVGVRIKRGRYEAYSKMDGKYKYLGLHSTPTLAHKAWQMFKVERLRSEAHTLEEDGFYAQKIIVAILHRAELITQDIEMGLITTIT